MAAYRSCVLQIFVQSEQKKRIGVDERKMIWYDSCVVRRFFNKNELAVPNCIAERRDLHA